MVLKKVDIINVLFLDCIIINLRKKKKTF